MISAADAGLIFVSVLCIAGLYWILKQPLNGKEK